MNIPETVAFLTWLSQTDSRVQVTEPNVQMWANALTSIPPTTVKKTVMEHYRTNEKLMPTPAMIRKAAISERDRAEAKQRAVTATAPLLRGGLTYRQRNPQEWDRLFQQGRDEGNQTREHHTQQREPVNADLSP